MNPDTVLNYPDELIDITRRQKIYTHEIPHYPVVMGAYNEPRVTTYSQLVCYTKLGERIYWLRAFASYYGRCGCELLEFNFGHGLVFDGWFIPPHRPDNWRILREITRRDVIQNLKANHYIWTADSWLANLRGIVLESKLGGEHEPC